MSEMQVARPGGRVENELGLRIGLGFRRCGSSWLHRILSAQPGIRKPENGLHFFSEQYEKGRAWYVDQIREGEECPIEMSITYGYPENVEDVLARIKECFGPVPVFAVVRNPVIRAYSDYLRALRVGDDISDMTFEEALVRYPECVQRGHYKQILEPVVRELGKQRIFILVYERLLENPEGELRRLFDFLEAEFDPDALPSDDQKLKWGRPRSRVLYSTIYGIKSVTDKLADWMGLGDGWSNLKRYFIKPYQRLIASLSKHDTMDEATRSQLVTTYREDVEWLRSEFGLDLPWSDFQETS